MHLYCHSVHEQVACRAWQRADVRARAARTTGALALSYRDLLSQAPAPAGFFSASAVVGV